MLLKYVVCDYQTTKLFRFEETRQKKPQKSKKIKDLKKTSTFTLLKTKVCNKKPNKYSNTSTENANKLKKKNKQKKI